MHPRRDVGDVPGRVRHSYSRVLVGTLLCRFEKGPVIAEMGHLGGGVDEGITDDESKLAACSRHTVETGEIELKSFTETLNSVNNQISAEEEDN